MKAILHCTFCDTALTFEDSDGSLLQFKGHTDDFCRRVTYSKCRALQEALKTAHEGIAEANYRLGRAYQELRERER